MCSDPDGDLTPAAPITPGGAKVGRIESTMQKSANSIESIFAAAAALATPEERAEYLDQACAGDAALREHVEALLKAHDRADHFLDRPVCATSSVPGNEEGEEEAPGAAVAPLATEQVGSYVGAFKLLQQLGEGG